MSSADNANAPTSGATSSSAPAKPSLKPAAELSESQYLQQQAELASEAISRAFREFSLNLSQGANPVEWARQYPWVSLGAAAVAGFVVANLVVPSKEDQAIKKLAALERALRPPPPVAETAATPDNEPARHGVVYGFLNQALKAIQPAIISAITSHVAKNEPTNGQTAATTPPPPSPPDYNSP